MDVPTINAWITKDGNKVDTVYEGDNFRVNWEYIGPVENNLNGWGISLSFL